MRSLMVGAYEVITALGLLGVIHMYLAVQRDPRIISLTLVSGELIVLYAVAAIASEALIVSRFRPATPELLADNILVAAIVTQPGWNGSDSLVLFVGIGTITAILRVFVAAISLRASKPGVRRFTSAAVGVPLLLASARAAFDQTREAYYNYYLFPKVKEGYIMPTRWQDLVALVTAWGGIFFLLYISYRLLKSVFRAEGERRIARG
jgi:hypothetical protein